MSKASSDLGGMRVRSANRSSGTGGGSRAVQARARLAAKLAARKDADTVNVDEPCSLVVASEVRVEVRHGDANGTTGSRKRKYGTENEGDSEDNGTVASIATTIAVPTSTKEKRKKKRKKKSNA